jgi:hypothetical protein
MTLTRIYTALIDMQHCLHGLHVLCCLHSMLSRSLSIEPPAAANRALHSHPEMIHDAHSDSVVD